MFRCVTEYLKITCVKKAATHFPKMVVTVSAKATMAVVGPLKTTDTSTNIPTEIKKTGIKSEFPKNSIRFINADECGISRFKASPAAKAPMIGSIPPSSAKKPQKNTTNSTKM
ncbi:hypothetical protein SDC9_111760 [bioreactor metagenome]|uniref:Uncharacterized protein n=1 Tax=bioreactor metagenome TaxID=1076179 RepID=A0A645BHB8_9ZZZZ